MRPKAPCGHPLQPNDTGSTAAVRTVDGLPLFTIMDYTAAQQEMLEVFAEKATIVGHEVGRRRYYLAPLPGVAVDGPPKRHIRQHRCPLIAFNGRVRLIEHNGNVSLLDPADLD